MIILIILALGVIIVCGVCGFINRRKKFKIENVQRQQWNARAKEGNKEKIFVILPSFTPGEVLKTVRLLFDRAFVPQRIYIGICASAKVGSLTSLGFFNKQVRVKVLPSHLNIGASVARQQIVSEFYNNEPFIFLTHSHSIPVQNWDAILLKSLSDAYEQGAQLITQIPGNVSVKNTSDLPIQNAPSTFAVLHPKSLTKELPMFYSRFCLGPESEKMYESPIITSKCLFGSAALMIDALKLFNFAIPLLTPSEDDFLLTLLCFLQGARAYYPHSSILFHIHDKHRVHSHQFTKSEKLKHYSKSIIQVLATNKPVQFRKAEVPSILHFLSNLNAHSQTYLSWIGLNLTKKAIAGRSVLGLTPERSRSEIIQKYGNIEDFENFRKTFCYD
jgi:hypothetical protein